VSVHTVSHGYVNSFVIVGNGVTLIDTGVTGGDQKILEALADLGKGPRDVHRIILTHLHADHAGAAARLKEVTGAPVYMHPVDAQLVRQGIAVRPGFTGVFPLNGLMSVAQVVRPGRYRPCEVDHEVVEGDVIEDGFQVVFTPGHSAGHISLLREGWLFAGDAATNLLRPGPPFIFEDQALSRESFQRLAGLEFELAGFGHGRTIERGASARFMARFKAV
jgi:glyoxylase-like metal-dependent hydrolase (beta-lactamase superfamily II)